MKLWLYLLLRQLVHSCVQVACVPSATLYMALRSISKSDKIPSKSHKFKKSYETKYRVSFIFVHGVKKSCQFKWKDLFHLDFMIDIPGIILT